MCKTTFVQFKSSCCIVRFLSFNVCHPLIMSSNKDRDSRSLSHDFDDSDRDDDHGKDDSVGRGKPGRKKNPDSAAARRDQNRIAQREFRLRKQQRIRDLEARVEILSGSKEEVFAELREVVKGMLPHHFMASLCLLTALFPADLMQENQNLRNIIRGLGGYIGEGLGGILPSLGFERPQEFVDFLNRAETDTAYEGFQRRKKAIQTAAASGSSATAGGINSNVAKKRSISEDMSSRKRVKDDHFGLNGTGASGKDADGSRYPSISVPISPATAGASFYSTVGRSSNDRDLFSELLHGQGGSGSGTASSMYMTGPVPESSGFTATPPNVSSVPQYPSAFHPPLNVTSSLGPQPFLSNMSSNVPAQTPSSTASEPPEQDEGIDDPKLHEASKLIQYHLDNYKRNNAYCLPQSLRPTLVQRTVPHESVIDTIPHPELRDRLILLRGRFDLVDALHDYTKSLTLHGDDVLAHSNWELGENWLRRYGFLVDQPVLNICNRWRRERGEPELSLADIQHASQEVTPST
ncbi:hypothetical protein A7U60_g8448 [Sanghuangporus baumii]|uniref:BZIP domain-containing protein n=1 Tax=Sanghuangporus baumii TaxID=108892 RepID=A0A9Q5HR45_SANBA|nr:hypothetical protein A7U60_g8448 [Sanghuangporus baumii]